MMVLVQEYNRCPRNVSGLKMPREEKTDMLSDLPFPYDVAMLMDKDIVMFSRMALVLFPHAACIFL
jgi:hypothetical protein